jgi:hypothetical protein
MEFARLDFLRSSTPASSEAENIGGANACRPETVSGMAHVGMAEGYAANDLAAVRYAQIGPDEARMLRQRRLRNRRESCAFAASGNEETKPPQSTAP